MIQVGPFQLFHFSAIDSTSEEAKRRVLSDGVRSAGMAFIADSQTHGRGRQGRKWESPIGNMFLSWITDISELQHLNHLPFIISLAVWEVIARYVPVSKAQVAMKWPNDILINQAKVCGMLIEKVSSDPVIIIGVGINILHVPNVEAYKVTALCEYEAKPDRMDVAAGVLKAFNDKLLLYKQSGWDAIYQEWCQNCFHKTGDHITVRLPGVETAGTFLEVNTNGCIVIRDQGGVVHRFNSGDVIIQ